MILENAIFPNRADYANASIIPIYVEPLIYSGERLCIGVLARWGDSIDVLPVRELPRLACVYGPSHKSLVWAQELALDSLKAYLQQNGMDALSGWKSPVEGVFLGTLRSTSARTIDDALRYSISQYSSLHRESASDIAEEATAEEEQGASLTGSRLEQAIKDAILSVRPDFTNRFGKKYRVKDSARAMRLGFVGQRLVANFGLIMPNSLSLMVQLSKARLWDLASARRGVKDGWFGDAPGSEFELLVHHATRDDVQYSERQIANVDEALEELEEEADKLEIRATKIVTPSAIAKHVLEKEAQIA